VIPSGITKSDQTEIKPLEIKAFLVLNDSKALFQDHTEKLGFGLNKSGRAVRLCRIANNSNLFSLIEQPPYIRPAAHYPINI